MEQAGIGRDEALAALLPLVRGTVENIADNGVEGAVTGPVFRGDLETVDLHLRALDAADRRLYAVLALELLRLGADDLPEATRMELIERLNRELVP
jgi:predicted short-subunit dehydrogenase-like oxidoreductase (DUF2520 family)